MAKQVFEDTLEELGITPDLWDSMDKDSRSLYNCFTIAKKDGSERTIEAPCPELKEVQRRILTNFIYPYLEASNYAHGFVKKRNGFTAARHHIDKDVVIRIDIKDFFPSVTWNMVMDALCKWWPIEYDSQSNTASSSQRNARTMTPDDRSRHIWVMRRACFLDKRLPQGAPTSPALSNIACRSLDYTLAALARLHKASYTRYADDIVLSARYECKGPKRDGQVAWQCEHYVRKLMHPDNMGMCSGCRMAGPELPKKLPMYVREIKKAGFVLNKRKTRISRRGRRQKVNGMTVNQGMSQPRVSSDYRRMTRAMVKNMLLYELFGDDDYNKGRRRCSLSQVKGRISYIHMASPDHAAKLWKGVRHIETLRDRSEDNKERRQKLRAELIAQHRKAT